MKKLLLVLVLVPIVGTAQDRTIRLYDRAAPGSESWNWEEKQDNKDPEDQITYNVVNPTLTVYSPAPTMANGTGIIVVPGGAFMFLAIKNEGYDVAKWLVEKGFTVFVLKYRTLHLTNDDPKGFLVNHLSNWQDLVKDQIPFSVADGRVAIAYVRTHAAEYKIKPNRIGMIGFSAGGTVTASTAFEYNKNNRPDFIAPIYPYFPENMQKPVLADAPPMFLLAASNDEGIFNLDCIGLYKHWFANKKTIELHLYADGKHGFGMKKQNLPTDNWIDRFYEFLQGQGFITN